MTPLAPERLAAAWLVFICVFPTLGCEKRAAPRTVHSPHVYALAQGKGYVFGATGRTRLHRGESLHLAGEGGSDHLKPNTLYKVTATHIDSADARSDDATICCGSGSSSWLSGHLMTDIYGKLPHWPVLFNVGEQPAFGIREGDFFRVELDGAERLYKAFIGIEPRRAGAPPHVFAATSKGKLSNVFVVGCPGGHCANAPGGKVFVAGDHFPPSKRVAIYIVRDRDDWAGRALPQAGNAELVAGPISARSTSEGRLGPLDTGFMPATQHVGRYDILVDVDGDGVFDHGKEGNDAVDGQRQTGFAVQLSRAWVTGKGRRHLLTNLAYDPDTDTFPARIPGPHVHVRIAPPVHLPRPEEVSYRPRTITTGIVAVVAHQPWDSFWNSNDPALDAGCPGCRDVSKLVVKVGHYPAALVVAPQHGSLTTTPLALFDARAPIRDLQGRAVKRFDVVFLPHQNNRRKLIYEPGASLLDVSDAPDPGLLDPAALSSKSYGFSIE